MKEITISLQDFLDILLRDGVKEFAAIDLDLGKKIQASDPEEEIAHVEISSHGPCMVYYIKTWRESETRRQRLKESSDRQRKERLERQEQINARLDKLRTLRQRLEEKNITGLLKLSDDDLADFINSLDEKVRQRLGIDDLLPL